MKSKFAILWLLLILAVLAAGCGLIAPNPTPQVVVVPNPPQATQTPYVVTATPAAGASPATQTPVVPVVTPSLPPTSSTEVPPPSAPQTSPTLSSPGAVSLPTATSEALLSTPNNAPSESTVAPATTEPTSTPLSPAPANTPVPAAPGAPVGLLAYTTVSAPGDNVPEYHSIWVANADGSGAHQILTRARWPSITSDGSHVLFYNMNTNLEISNLDGSQPQLFIGEQFSYGAIESPDRNWVGIIVNPGRAPTGNYYIDLVTNAALNRHKLTEGFRFSWSPDSSRVVYQGCAPGGDPCGIFIIALAGGGSQLLTGNSAGSPSWCRNNRIAFTRDVNGVKQIFVINADGSGERQLTTGASIHASPSFDRSCNFIYYRSPQAGPWGIWVMSADGTGQHQVIPNVGVDDLWYAEPVSVY